MTDLAALGLTVRSDGVVVATDRLEDFKGASDKAGQGADNVGKKSNVLSGSLRKLAGVAGVVAGGLAAMFSARAIISGISDFETSMSKVAAITRATDGDLANLRQTAMDLGITTEFSAGQAADALGFLGMAGFTAAESIAAIPAVLDLATASGMGLAAAADTASNIMSGFGIAADNAAQVADVLAAASSRANTDVSQLGSAMSTVAPISAALGIDLADTAAAIGVLSDAGIQGERAGTALRGAMAALAGPTTAATDALAKYGLTAADVDPATNSLADVMGRLQAAGLSTADAMTIFGREAASGALVLAGSSERLREFGNELRNVDGAASDMAGTMRDNLGGDLAGLQSAVSGLILALGEAGLTAVLRVVVGMLTALVRGVSSAVAAVSGFFTSVNNFISAQVNMGVATDNVTLAMGDEIAQANALFTLMGNGNTMTQSAALAKLSEAEAHLRNADALRQETQAMVDLQYAALELQRITSMDALRSIAAPGTDLADIAAHLRDSYEETEQTLARIVSDQASLNALTQASATSFADAQAEVQRIREAIGNAVDGMVTFDGQVVTAVSLTNRLAQAAGSVNFNNAIATAAFLANDIGVNIEMANKLNEALNRSAGIEKRAQAARLTYGLPPVTVPNDVSNRNLGFGNLLNTPSNTRFDVPDLSPVSSAVSGLSGGGRGGGGSIASAAREATAAVDDTASALRDAAAAQDAWAKNAAGHFDGLITGGKKFSGVLQSIAGQLESKAWEGLFGLFNGGGTAAPAPASGGGGGFLSGLLSGVGSWLQSFSGGGYTGDGPRSGGLDGQGGRLAMIHPRETVVDHMRPQNSAQGGASSITLRVISDAGVTVQQVGQIATGVAVQVVQSGMRQTQRALPSQLGTLESRGTT